MSIVDRVKTNVSDLRTFGPSILLRHFARLKADKIARGRVNGFGRVYLRTGNSDIASLRQIFAEREYALKWPEALADRILSKHAEIVERGNTPVIIDAGANIGAASLWFAQEFPRAHVLAIEPDPANVIILRKNVERLPNVSILEAAIGARPGFVALSHRETGWGVRTARAEAGVEVVTVDGALAKVPDGEPFITKIDIEGFENDLFADNIEWLEEAFALFIEPHDWMLTGQKTSRSFQQAIARHDFEVFIRGENLLYVRA